MKDRILPVAERERFEADDPHEQIRSRIESAIQREKERQFDLFFAAAISGMAKIGCDNSQVVEKALFLATEAMKLRKNVIWSGLP